MTGELYMTTPDGDRDWVAVAVDGPYIVALQWRRGEPCPTAAFHVGKLRAARDHFAKIKQTEPDGGMDGFAVEVSDGVDRRWVTMYHSQNPGWLPYGANDYTM